MTAGIDQAEASFGDGANARKRVGADYLPEIAQLTVVLLWASTFILTKDAFEDVLPLAYVFFRFILISALALGVLAIQGARNGWRESWHIDRADLPRFVMAGLSGYTFYQLGFTLGLEHTSPFSSSLLISMVPLFSLMIVTIRGERSPIITWVGVGVAIFGVLIFLSDKGGGGSWFGNGMSLMAAVSFAFYGVINRPLVVKYSAQTIAAYTTLLGTIPLAVIGAPSAIRQDWSQVPLSTWLVIVYMAILPIYIAYMLWNWAIRQRGVAATSWSLLVPVASGIFSALVFDEQFGIAKITGGALAIAGLILMRRRQ